MSDAATIPPSVQMVRYRYDTKSWESPTSVVLDDAQFPGLTNSPTLIVAPDGRLAMLVDTTQLCILSGCSTIHERLLFEEPGSDGTHFAAQTADAVTTALGTAAGTPAAFASDPAIFFDGRQYNLYLPMATAALPQGQISLFTSASLPGPYVLSTALPNGGLAADGVAQGSGFYNAAFKQYWHYFSDISARLGRAVTPSLAIPVSYSAVTSVVTSAELGLGANSTLQHPHFATNWSGTASLTATVMPRALSGQTGTPLTATVTLTNGEDVSAGDCFVGLRTAAPVSLSYQAMTPFAGPPNTPVAIPAGATQTFAVTLTPSAAMNATELTFDLGCASTTLAVPASGVNTLTLSASGPNVMPTGVIPEVEYYDPQLDHYFITASTAEIAALDGGLFPGWVRTGYSWHVDAPGTSAPGSSPVCRLYGEPSAGLDTHFYSASPDECAAVLQRFPGAWVEESNDVFEVFLPNTLTGACPGGTVPLYRAWNQRADSNHRYSTDPNVILDMISRGYVAEGYGPNFPPPVMCVPQ